MQPIKFRFSSAFRNKMQAEELDGRKFILCFCACNIEPLVTGDHAMVQMLMQNSAVCTHASRCLIAIVCVILSGQKYFGKETCIDSHLVSFAAFRKLKYIYCTQRSN